MDLSKPLSRGRRLKIGERSLWIPFKYEKIPKFCFRCRTIKHGNQGCIRLGRRGADNEPEFGPWLRVGLANNRGEGRFGGGWRQQHSSPTYERSHHGWDGRRPGERGGQGDEDNGRGGAGTTTEMERGKPGIVGKGDNVAQAQMESEKSGDSFRSIGEEINFAVNEEPNWGRNFPKCNGQGDDFAEGSNGREARNLGEQFLCNYYTDSGSNGGYTVSKEKAPATLPEFISKELKMGDSPNVYLDQWDAIKERMV